MPQVIIANPVTNSPFDEPTLHIRSCEGTIKRARGAGPSSYCARLAKTRKVAQVLHFVSREQVGGISIQESSTGNGSA